MKIVSSCSLIGGLVLVALSCPSQAAVVVSANPGYGISFDGNEGDYFNSSNPAPAPANLSTAAGATAFASGVLNVGPHTSANLVRDGFYGNSASWIGNTATPTYVGINLGGTFDINAIAWSRDNGNAAEGQLTDRSLGTYSVQITNSLTPASTTNWTTVGTLNYASNDDGTIGGGFTSYFRHQYGISKSGGPLLATGVRLVVPLGGIAGGTAIDELELYGQSPVPASGLRSWVRGDGDVTTSGALITQMGDHSLNGNHAVPGASPDLAANAINGLSAARFSGNDHLDMPTAMAINNSDYEIFVVAKSSSANTQFLTSGSSTTGEFELQINGTQGARFLPATTATASPDTFADLGVNGQFSDGRTHLFNTRVEGGIGKLRVVGMENGDTVSNAQSSFAGVGGDLVTLGVRGNATFRFIGDMGEVLVYNRALNATERRQVERYLAKKWNAPLNVASQTQGGVAFANELINGGGYTAHQINHLNDAKYGNDFSWIGNDNGGSNAFAGVKFDDAYNISSLAFGRSATNSHSDRDVGTYTFQYTLDDFNPNSLASINAATWTTFFTQIVTDSATSHLRHQYDFSTIYGARGVRVLLSNNSIAIDELEIYGVIPEPASFLSSLIGGLALIGIRRRRRWT